MMCAAGDTEGRRSEDEPETAKAPDLFCELLDDSAEDLYDNAPCGYVSTLLDGTIAKINATLLSWLGYRRAELVGRRRFDELLTVGGRLYHETHFAPLLRMRGEVNGIAFELRTVEGLRLPVLVSSKIRYGSDGHPQMIRTTIFDASERRAYETELLRARREAERERERLQRLTSILQRTLLPSALEPVPGLEVAAHYHPASLDEVGGDFYDLFPLADGDWGFFLGDVCGKGALAASFTSRVRYALRAAAVYDPDPASVLRHLNDVLLSSYHPGDPRFCTVIYGRLTLRRNRVRVEIASGGHPQTLVIRGDGRARFVPTPGGQLIGVLPTPDIAAATTHLDPGDTLLLYTDGIIEARTAAGDLFGEDRLLDLAHALAPTSATGLITRLAELLDTLGEGVGDDTALLAIHLPQRAAAQPDGE